ncbi:N-acetylglucosamine kinase [Tumebacillus permanentifrigoris]|uniref:N-acetylglucosamine kinase-like BadF-type ATPase n=1 Tax=Tumebacillus permanentifrigoris TaxID=378543 RepID=A0A316DCE8_9BACL|nr:BadF/BadG/BcrA/BcrD ATPase family protein [Tumebacillus permanentifrigoris]PWK15625.1 N-acetylglucosamine kinase-like BadF-type ATPase [Tumebacillus permanentifrigoris]
MQVYIGIDGGGTKTRTVVFTEQGTQLHDLTTAGCNINHHGWSGAEASLRELFDQLRATLPPTAQVAAICLGLAGIDREPERLRMEFWVANQWPEAAVRVVHDALIALAAGTEQREGIVLIAGTGSVAYGRNAAGVEARVGGWGYLLGDEGSGYDIGRRALTAVLRQNDGRDPQTALTELVLNSYGLREPTELIPLVYGEAASREQVARAAHLVFEAAASGDAVALSLLAYAAGELAAHVVALLQKMNFTAQRIPVVLAGGLFFAESPLRGLLATALPDHIELRLGQPPVFGALRLAQAGR